MQYQDQETQTQQQRIALKPLKLKLKRRNRKGLLWAVGAIASLAAGITLYKQPAPSPAPMELPQPMPSPVSGNLPSTSVAVSGAPPPLISVQPIEETVQSQIDISHLVKVTAKPVAAKPVAKTLEPAANPQSKIQNPKSEIFATNSTTANRLATNPAAQKANQLATKFAPQGANQLTTSIDATTARDNRWANPVAASSLAAPVGFVARASPALANPIAPSSLGASQVGTAIGGFAKTALAKIAVPTPPKSQVPDIPQLGSDGGSGGDSSPPGGGSGGGLPDGSEALGGGKFRTPNGTVMQEVDCVTGKPVTR